MINRRHLLIGFLAPLVGCEQLAKVKESTQSLKDVAYALIRIEQNHEIVVSVINQLPDPPTNDSFIASTVTRLTKLVQQYSGGIDEIRSALRNADPLALSALYRELLQGYLAVYAAVSPRINEVSTAEQALLRDFDVDVRLVHDHLRRRFSENSYVIPGVVNTIIQVAPPLIKAIKAFL